MSCVMCVCKLQKYLKQDLIGIYFTKLFTANIAESLEALQDINFILQDPHL